jgi:hypothetical protein
MNAATIRRRLERLEARRAGLAPELPETEAELITGFLQIKYIQRYEPSEPPEPIDWDATLEQVRKLMIERGHDPDARH